MGYAFFSDESGIHTKDKCYTIGAILVPDNMKDRFIEFLKDKREYHNIRSEIKWEGVRKSYNVMNFAIDLLTEIVKGPYKFTCIVVMKNAFRKWNSDKDNAFYTTYTLLLKHCTEILGTTVEAHLDNKCEAYPKHHEVVEIIVNYKLKNSTGSVSEVSKHDSKSSLILQAADILTGAINASHHLYLDRNINLNNGKRLLIQKLAQVVGWDALHYDTYPNASMNIWHFPYEEYRAIPKTLDIIPNLSIQHINRNELSKYGI